MKFFSYLLLVLISPYNAFSEEIIDLDPLNFDVSKPQEIKRKHETAKVLNKNEIREKRIDQIQDVVRETPNMFIQDGGDGQNTQINIRGIGASTLPYGHDDASVTTYLDGIPLPIYMADNTLLDLESFSVIKGSPGALYSRNSIGGALVLESAKPSDSFEHSYRLEAGGDKQSIIEAKTTGPMGKQASGLISIKHSKIDGYIDNEINDEKFGGNESYAGRLKTSFKPIDSLEINLGLFGERNQSRPAGFVILNSSNENKISITDRTNNRKWLGTSLEVIKKNNDVEYTVLTSLQKLDIKLKSDDSDGYLFERYFGIPRADSINDNENSLWNETVKIFTADIYARKKLDNLDWLIGAGYLKDWYSATTISNSDYLPVNNGKRETEFDTGVKSLYAEINHRMTDLVNFGLGFRGGQEIKKLASDYQGNGYPGTVDEFGYKDDLNFEYLNARAYAYQKWSNWFGTQASVARGFKSGGFQRFGSNLPFGFTEKDYRPSYSWNYELSAMIGKEDSKFHFGISAFLNDIKDDHLATIDMASFRATPENIDIQSKGIELTGHVLFLEDSSFMSSVAYTESELQNVSKEIEATVMAKTGDQTPLTPKVTYTNSLKLSFKPFKRNETVHLITTHQYVSRRWGGLGNTYELPSYHMVYAKLSYQFGNYDLYIYGNNLFDEDIINGAGSMGPDLTVGLPARGKLVGAGLIASFD